MWQNLNSFVCEACLCGRTLILFPVWRNLNSFACDACLCGRISTGFACEGFLSGEMLSSVSACMVCMCGLPVWRDSI